MDLEQQECSDIAGGGRNWYDQKPLAVSVTAESYVNQQFYS